MSLATSNSTDDLIGAPTYIYNCIEELKNLGINYSKNKLNREILKFHTQKANCNRRFQLSLYQFEETLLYNVVLGDRNFSVNIPAVLSECLTYLEDYLDTKFIFRVSPAFSRLKQLQEELSKSGSCIRDLSPTPPPQDVAGLIKLFLRELTEPLFPDYITSLFLQCLSLPLTSRLKSLLYICSLLPPAHVRCLHALVSFFCKVAERSRENSMNKNNLAVVLSPNLFSLRDTLKKPTKECSTNKELIEIVETLLSHPNEVGRIEANDLWSMIPTFTSRDRRRVGSLSDMLRTLPKRTTKFRIPSQFTILPTARINSSITTFSFEGQGVISKSVPIIKKRINSKRKLLQDSAIETSVKRTRLLQHNRTSQRESLLNIQYKENIMRNKKIVRRNAFHRRRKSILDLKTKATNKIQLKEKVLQKETDTSIVPYPFASIGDNIEFKFISESQPSSLPFDNNNNNNNNMNMNMNIDNLLPISSTCRQQISNITEENSIPITFQNEASNQQENNDDVDDNINNNINNNNNNNNNNISSDYDDSEYIMESSSSNVRHIIEDSVCSEPLPCISSIIETGETISPSKSEESLEHFANTLTLDALPRLYVPKDTSTKFLISSDSQEKSKSEPDLLSPGPTFTPTCPRSTPNLLTANPMQWMDDPMNRVHINDKTVLLPSSHHEIIISTNGCCTTPRSILESPYHTYSRIDSESLSPPSQFGTLPLLKTRKWGFSLDRESTREVKTDTKKKNPSTLQPTTFLTSSQETTEKPIINHLEMSQISTDQESPYYYFNRQQPERVSFRKYLTPFLPKKRINSTSHERMYSIDANSPKTGDIDNSFSSKPNGRWSLRGLFKSQPPVSQPTQISSPVDVKLPNYPEFNRLLMTAKSTDSPPNLTPLNKRHCDKDSPLFMNKPMHYMNIPANNSQSNMPTNEPMTIQESPYACMPSLPSIVSSDNSDSFSSQSSLHSLPYKSKIDMVTTVISKPSTRKLPPRPTRMPPPPPTNILPQTKTYKISKRHKSKEKKHKLVKNELGQQECSKQTENWSINSSMHEEDSASIYNIQDTHIYQSLSSNYLLPPSGSNSSPHDTLLPMDAPGMAGPKATSIRVLPPIPTMPTLRKTHQSEKLGISSQDRLTELHNKVPPSPHYTKPVKSRLEMKPDYSKMQESNNLEISRLIIETKPMPDVANCVKMFEALSKNDTYNDICRVKNPNDIKDNSSRVSFSGFSSKKKHLPNVWRHSALARSEK